MSEMNQKDNPGGTPPEQNSSPPPSGQPTSGGQYWSSQDARRASGSQPPPRYTQPNSYQRPYEPYQQGRYTPPGQTYGAGWQQPPRPEGYEWNFDDYDKLAGKRKKTNKGLIVFAIAILGILSVSLIAMSGISIYNSLRDNGSTTPREESGYYMEDDAVIPTPERDSSGTEGPEVSRDSSVQMEVSGRPDVPEVELVDGRLTIPQVAKKLLPSVVSVESYRSGYFYEAAGLGSGIIMNTDGYIITNQHVIADSSALKVTLNNGEPYEAVIIGQDERTDLAVIKINAPDLVPAEFGDSEELEVGETVVAIGNPASMELAGSVTKGIVSAVNRQVQTTTYSMTYIQTDAAINPGNSGGALVNEFGQVVGINSSKIVQEGFEGIGFAIPISVAKPVIDDLVANGRVTGRVMLGITAQQVDEVAARNYNVPMGLMIRSIDPNSDLANKDVRVNDILTHINGERVYTLNDLREQLDNYKVGDRVQLTLFRQSSVLQGTTFDVTITLVEDLG